MSAKAASEEIKDRHIASGSNAPQLLNETPGSKNYDYRPPQNKRRHASVRISTYLCYKCSALSASLLAVLSNHSVPVSQIHAKCSQDRPRHLHIEVLVKLGI